MGVYLASCAPDILGVEGEGALKATRALRSGGDREEGDEQEGQHLRNPPPVAVAPRSAPGN